MPMTTASIQASPLTMRLLLDPDTCTQCRKSPRTNGFSTCRDCREARLAQFKRLATMNRATRPVGPRLG